MIVENYARNATLLMTKKIEADMFGFTEGQRSFSRKYKKKAWYGSIVEHTYWEFTLKSLDNTVLRKKISYHGFYKWIKERASKILALENSNL